MTTIQAQLEWEDAMVSHGVDRFRGQQDKAVEGDRAYETSAGARLLRSYVMQVSEHIRLYLDGKHPGGRRRNQYAKLLATIDTDKAALLSLKAIINTLYNPQPTQSVCISIGRAIEDELRFAKFEAEHKDYYDEIVREWERKRTTSYRHKRRGLINVSKKTRDGYSKFEWQDWPREVHLKVGSLVVSLLMEACDLVETTKQKKPNGQHDVFLTPTEKCIEWVSKHNDAMELVAPDRKPCIIPPDDWTSPTEGGFYSPLMRRRTPLVKTRGTAGKHQDRLLAKADMPRVYQGINAMQRTAWQVNSKVFEVMREVWHKNLGIGMPSSRPYEVPACPLPADVKVKDLDEDDPRVESFVNWKAEAREVHTLERERVAHNLQVVRTVRLATEMEKYDAFWYVYTCDFRGRVYCSTSGLSPQGTDHGKALLQFAEAKPLGERGLRWLKIHGAGKWGQDKCSEDEQVQWIEDRHDDWLRCAADPIGASAIWGNADKPYQFLAFCFEYAEAARVGTSFRSRLPIALDGTCNGLQHFSAMLRDEVGGAAVNLTPSDKPSDIYQNVGDVATRRLTGLRSLTSEERAGAENWLALFKEQTGEEKFPRKLAKPPVMTKPYGSTRQTCTATIYKWTMDNAPKFFEKNTTFRHALYLTPVLWDSINEVVVSARDAMGWLQKAAGKLTKAGHPVEYHSPLGFPFYQAQYKYTSKQIETQIGGRLQIRLASDTDKLDGFRQRNGIAPNFVHNSDCSHMLDAVCRGEDEGIDAFAMVHDDFGVHACDTDKWCRIIRESFVWLHGEHDLLEDFKVQQEERTGIELDETPPRGRLDINKVLQSTYFFH